MFRAVFLPIIRSFLVVHCVQFMQFGDRVLPGAGWNCSSILRLVALPVTKLHKLYQCRCTAKNSWWWAEWLPETCRVIITIKLELSASVCFIHKESITLHGHTVLKCWTVSCADLFTKFVERTDRNSFTLLSKVYLPMPPIFTKLIGHSIFGHLLYRNLSKLHKNVKQKMRISMQRISWNSKITQR
jgi:hypothetical protein